MSAEKFFSQNATKYLGGKVFAWNIITTYEWRIMILDYIQIYPDIAKNVAVEATRNFRDNVKLAKSR